MTSTSSRMFHNRAVVLAAVLLTSALVTTAWAADPSLASAEPSPPVAAACMDGGDAPMPYTDVIRYAGSALRPRENDVSYSVSGQGGCLYATTGDTSTWFNLSIELPDGALVEYVRLYANDSSASYNCQGFFTVYDLYGNIVEEHGMTSSGSSGNGYWTTPELEVRIDYLVNSYVLNWRPNVLGSTMQLCGFRIYYSMP